MKTDVPWRRWGGRSRLALAKIFGTERRVVVAVSVAPEVCGLFWSDGVAVERADLRQALFLDSRYCEASIHNEVDVRVLCLYPFIAF